MTLKWKIDAVVPGGLLVAGMLALSLPAHADAVTDCLMKSLETAPDTATVAEIRARCQQPAAASGPATTATATDAVKPRPSAMEERITEEFSLAEREYFLTAYRPTFLLPVAYNSKPNDQVFTDINPAAPELYKNEVEFQVSFKFPLARQL